MKKLKSIIPGTAVCAVIAAVATLTGGISIGGFSFELIGAPVIAILLGMILTLVFPKLASLTSLSGGIKFTSKKILQWAVVILGFSLNLSTIAQVGAKSLPVIVGTISMLSATQNAKSGKPRDKPKLSGINQHKADCYAVCCVSQVVYPARYSKVSCQKNRCVFASIFLYLLKRRSVLNNRFKLF